MHGVYQTADVLGVAGRSRKGVSPASGTDVRVGSFFAFPNPVTGDLSFLFVKWGNSAILPT